MIELMFHAYTNLGEYLSFQSSIVELLLYKSYNRKQKIDKQNVYGCWHELPKDTMEMIIQRLNLTERICLSIVCKSWRSLFMQKDILAPQLPWLLLPQVPNFNHLSFCSLSEGTLHHLKMPKSAQGGWCCGSSKGWLFIAKETRLKSEIFLLNPISGARRQLPSLATIPSFREFVNILSDPYTVSCFVDRIELSSSDTSECTVAAIFNYHQVLAFCRPGDKRWSIFQGRDDIAEEIVYNDILFSNETTLYALPGSETKGGVVAAYKLGFADREVTLKLLPDLTDEPEYVDIEVHGDIGIAVEGCNSIYLVESTNGELLMIRKIMDEFLSKDEEEDDDENEYPDLRYYRTRRFEVFKLGLNNGTSCMTRLNSLGGQVLFLSTTGSLFLRARDFNGIQGNCIYFAEDSKYFMYDHPPLMSRESGVFYLDDGRVERSFPSVVLPMHSNMSGLHQIHGRVMGNSQKQWSNCSIGGH